MLCDNTGRKQDGVIGLCQLRHSIPTATLSLDRRSLCIVRGVCTIKPTLLLLVTGKPDRQGSWRSHH